MDRLADRLDSNARVELRTDGDVAGTRRIVDLTSDDGTVTFATTDDGTNDVVTVDLSVPGSVGGPGGPPTGPAGGALDGTYPNPGLAASVAGAGLTETSDVLSVNVSTGLQITSDALRLTDTGITPGDYGDSSHIPVATIDAQGRVSAVRLVTVSSASDTAAMGQYAAGQLATTAAPGGVDLDWTGSTFTENTAGEVFDFNGSSFSDNLPTLQVTQTGVYAITFFMKAEFVSDATFIGFTLYDQSNRNWYPTNDGTDIAGLYVYLNGSMTYHVDVNSSFTFWVNHDASAELDVDAYFAIQRLN